jgi:Fe-S cluster assembly protein SufD
MRDLRLHCWETFEALPLPTNKDEEWRRTDLRWLKLDGLRLATPNGATPLPAAWQPTAEALAARGGFLVQRDATPAHRTVGDELAAMGVILTDMDTAVREHGDLVRRAFMTEAVKPTFSKFAALNGALWSGGTFLYVPDNVEVSLPLQSSLWLDEGGLGLFPHTLVVLGRNSKANLIEEAGSQNAEGTLSVPVVELILHEGANLTYSTMQEFDASPRQLAIHRAVLERDSTLHWLTVTLGGAWNKLTIDTELRGPGTNAELLGMYFTDGTEFLDYHTLQDHISPNTNSDLLFKGVLTGESRVVFSGLIRVHAGAQKTDAYQKNNNLILSPHARADSIPNLEISANDVRCSHGATAGKVAEDQLFYLMSRGLTRHEAERIIVTGFLTPLIERLPLADLRDRLYALIDAKMS